LTLRQMTAILAAICVFGATGIVFAQDDAENQFDPVIDIINDNDGNAEDDADDGGIPSYNLEKPPKQAKSGKPSKSKSKKRAEAAVGDEALAKSESKSNKQAAQPAGTTLKYNGLVAAGVDFNRKVNRKEGNAVESKRVVKGELELSAQPVKKVRAEIGIEYNINGRVMVADSLGVKKYVSVIDPMEGTAALADVDYELLKGLGLGPFVTIDKIYVQYNIVDQGTVRAGIMKKAFGLEERAGLDERCFLKRSIINNGLEDLGFLDHDLTVAYRHDLLKDVLRLTGAFSWSIADSLVYLQNYSAHYRPAKNMEFLLAGIIKHNTDTTGGNPSTTYAASLSFKYEAVSWCVSEAELTIGTNPLIWELYRRKTTLLGVRVQERFPIDVNTKILRRVVPAAEVAVFTADIDSGYSTKPFDPAKPNKPDKSGVETQIKAGVTLGFAKNSAFQFRNNFGTIIRTENDKNTNGKKSTVKRYRFDSEVVVIF